MNKGKQRTLTHITEDVSIKILEKHFPSEWVVRKYIPDYGIDIGVEIFEPYKEGFITTGEHIYFQVKGTQNLVIGESKIFKRHNVEKGLMKGAAYKKIEVVKFQIETALLATVEKMGSAVPVLLAVVDTLNENTYFICLNDYIEKVIIPEKPNYQNQDTIVLSIPKDNILNSATGLSCIKWYAKRAKLFSIFNKISYQNAELEYTSNDELQVQTNHFLKILFRHDAWSAIDYFAAMKFIKEDIDFYMEHGITKDAKCIIESYKSQGKDINEEIWETAYSNHPLSFEEAQKLNGLRSLWNRLNTMGQMFEDISKEWLLPTYVGVITN